MSNMNILRRNFLGGIAATTAFAAAIAHAADPGFVDLFDGRTLNGWKPNGGSAEYSVEDGAIAGVGVPGTPGNTFLCTEREYENFIFKAEFKCPSGNSGIQFRSSTKPAPNFKNGTSVFGYQCEITPFGSNSGRIYDEGRRGFRNGIIWLDNTPKEREQEMLKTFKKDDWNSVVIQCVGPSIKTFINGVKVSDILDDCQQRGFFGLQIHAQKKTDKDGTPIEPGRAWWRNIQIKELPPCPAWKKFFVKGSDGKMKVDGAKYVIPQDWSFVEDKDGAYLRGVHDKTEKKDGLVISLADYDNFMARVTYKLNGGNSALYFRAAEEDVPWVLKGFQNEIAGNNKDSALWHTQGKETKGRGWVASNDELVAKVRDDKGGWNTVSTIAVGDRIVNRINGFETFDIVDPLCEKTGKLGLQLHGGADNEMRFKDWEVMPVEPWMLPYILPEQKANAAEKSEGDAKAAEIVQRMKEMRLPKMEFAPPKTIIDAVDFFRDASKKYDSPDLPLEKRGFNFVLRMDPDADAPTIPWLKASDISFYDALKLVCECVDYTFEVGDMFIMVMSKKDYTQMKEEGKKAKIEKRAGKSGKESEAEWKKKSKQPFRIYRFCVDRTKSPTYCMQLSEFELYDAGGKLIPSGKFELEFDGNGGDDDFGDGERPECAVDGSLYTKWLDFRADSDGTAERRSAVWIQFKFAEPTKLSGYRWYTANDAEERDPRSWRLLGSDDGVNWVVVDKVEDFEATSDRNKLAFTALFGSVALVKTSTPEGWLDDYDAALKKAAAENKYVLIDFSGSDWCGCCKALDKEVFATDEFRKGAAEKYVLLMVDKPRDKSFLTPKAAEENPKLMKKFVISCFPTVVVLDSKGDEVTRMTGYQARGPEKYLKKLDEEIRFAPEIKKYIKPIEDVLKRHNADILKDCKAVWKGKVYERFPKSEGMMPKAEWQKYLQDTMEYAEKVESEEVYPKYVPLIEKCIAEAKEMKVPAALEERKKALIEEYESRLGESRELIKRHKENNSAFAAPVLDGSGIRIEFDSEERGFDCLAIKNKLGGKGVQFGDGATDGSRAGLWAMKFWKDGKSSQIRWLTNHSPSSRSIETSDGRLKFLWKGLSLGDEKDVVDVAADVELTEDGVSAKWRIQVSNRSKTWGLAEVEYPIIRHVVASNTASALLPHGNTGGRLYERYSEGHNLLYPHGTVPMQTLAFMQDGEGLQFTTLDGKSQNKSFNTRGLDMKIWYRCPDEGCPGAANAPDYAVETAAFEGDWWVAAKRYRKWALRQQWASKGPLKDRTDFCKKIGNVGYWLIASGPSVVDKLSTLAKLLPDVPLGLHWYSWHNSPFDVNYPEMFPAKDGVKEAAAWMKENGVFCMPYINGSLWEDEIASFTNALPYTCKKPDGSYYTYKCGHNKNVLARMCPTTELWKKTVAENTRRLFDELNVDGVYLDQISCSLPQPCHDASHGHRLGGGEFWTQGYRDLMKPIREDAARRGAGLTSECAAEPYMDSFDAFLTWMENTPKDVPLLPAVYSGYALYFGSVQSNKDSLDSYCALQARMLLWGFQLGWSGILLGKGREEFAAFTHKLCRTRLENLDCFQYGELVGELVHVGEVPMVDVKWEYKDVGEFKAPAVFGTVWRGSNGEIRSFVVNVSGENQRVGFRLSKESKPFDVEIPPRSVKAISSASASE